MALAAGDRLGPYEILSAIGAGGMGEVYRARDPRLRRDVAIKILPQSAASNPERQRRLAQEAIAAGALNHPNILVVYDVGVEGDTPYIVSELIDGAALREEMQRGRLPVKRILEIAARVADGLAAAHGAGIVHRDLKPENVMAGRDGRIKIVDFGLAKPIFDETTQTDVVGPTQTATGLIVGTVPYMSPEQAAGSTVDFRSDQFSFGLMLYEMAAAAHPFMRPTPVQTLSAVIADEARALADANPALPAPLRWIIERCMAKDPRGRYAHTADLAADLQQLRDRVGEVTVATIERPEQRRPVAWLVGMAAAAIVAFVVATLVRPTQTGDPLRFVPLANDAGYQGQPAWSSDGKTVAYVAEVDGVLQVFTRSLTSVLRTQITRSRFDCHDPFWSHDGARLYFHSLAGGKDSLWAVSPAGGAADLVMAGASRAALSPDDRTLAVFREESESAVGMTLWFASPPGSEPQKYAQTPFDRAVSDGLLRYSPDGSRLLVWFNGYGGAAAAEGTRFVLLTGPGAAPKEALRSLAGPRAPPLFSWLPD